MFTKKEIMTKKEAYKKIIETIPFLFSNCEAVTNYANASALIASLLPNINWVGFYINTFDKLILGPFQGFPACTHINIGSGVVGKCALKKESIIVPNVHEFSGHIACDSRSNSEIVIPLIKNSNLISILDIDSVEYNCFDIEDEKNLNVIAEIMVGFL